MPCVCVCVCVCVCACVLKAHLCTRGSPRQVRRSYPPQMLFGVRASRTRVYTASPDRKKIRDGQLPAAPQQRSTSHSGPQPPCSPSCAVRARRAHVVVLVGLVGAGAPLDCHCRAAARRLVVKKERRRGEAASERRYGL